MSCAERYFAIDDDGYAFPLVQTLKPAYWLAPLQPNVHGFPLNDEQVRTDDYRRKADVLMLEGKLYGKNEDDLHAQAGVIRAWVQRMRWLQRASRASLRLLDGSDIELGTDGAKSRIGVLRVAVVAKNRKWIHPLTGQEVTG